MANSWFTLLLTILIIGFAYILKSKEIITKKTLLHIIWGALIIQWIIPIFLNSGKVFKKNIIIFKRRKYNPSFWSRNKDQLLVGIIVAIITIIITINLNN